MKTKEAIIIAEQICKDYKNTDLGTIKKVLAIQHLINIAQSPNPLDQALNEGKGIYIP